MKKKDVAMLAVAVAILLVAGYIAYSQLLGPKSGTSSTAGGTSVDVIGAITSDLDQGALGTLSDQTKTQDFTPQIDLTTGLGNPAPFGH